MYVLFFKERLHKVQDCSPEKRIIRNMIEKRQKVGKVWVFFYT